VDDEAARSHLSRTGVQDEIYWMTRQHSNG
jgi:hypothetical protein